MNVDSETANLVILMIKTMCYLLCRCTRLRPKVKRQRYTLLEDMEDSDRISSTGKLDLLPAGKIR